MGAATLAEVQAKLRRRVLRAATRRGLLDRDEAEAWGAWDHGGGFLLHASVRVEANDRQGLERLLRYCARPAFALERLREIDPEHLVYEGVKPGPGGSVTLMLTPLELLDRLGALIPPPRRRRLVVSGGYAAFDSSPPAIMFVVPADKMIVAAHASMRF